MNIHLVQRPIVWEDPQANFEAIDAAFRAHPPIPGSLVVFAEMFSTGFSFELQTVGEPAEGMSSQFLCRMAKTYDVCTVGSFPHDPQDSGKGLNRLVVFLPDGTLALRYDKIHPFSYGKEAEHYRGGTRLPLFDYQGWTVCPTVCYDLRFPEMYRAATLKGGAEMFLCIANWPTPRRDHWNTLLRARAIENQAVMVGVNRIGKDLLNAYSGDSVIIDARGRDILNLEDRESHEGAAVERNELLDWREKFPALADATYEFEIIESKPK